MSRRLDESLRETDLESPSALQTNVLSFFKYVEEEENLNSIRSWEFIGWLSNAAVTKLVFPTGSDLE